MGLPRALQNKIVKDMAVMLRAGNKAIELFAQYAHEAPSYYHGFWGEYNSPKYVKRKLIHNLKYVYRKRARRLAGVEPASGSFNKKRGRWDDSNVHNHFHDTYPRFARWVEEFAKITDGAVCAYPTHNSVNKAGDLCYSVKWLPFDMQKHYGRLYYLLYAKYFWMGRRRSEIEKLLQEHRFSAAADKRLYSGALRSYILKRANHRCEHCGSKSELQVDHIKPFSVGGKTTIENARVLCRKCNIGVYHLDQKFQPVAAE